MAAERSAERIKIAVWDMDNTITYSDRLTSKTHSKDTKEKIKQKQLPDNFFIEGALESIKRMKDLGYKVGIITHSYNAIADDYPAFKPFVIAALKEMGVELDFFVCMHDVSMQVNQKCLYEKHMKNWYVFEDKHRLLVEERGKGSADEDYVMFNIALKQMQDKGIIKDITQTDIEKVIVVGDSRDDVMFSCEIKNYLSSLGKNALVNMVHVDSAGLSTPKLIEVTTAVRIIERFVDVYGISDYSEFVGVLEEIEGKKVVDDFVFVLDRFGDDDLPRQIENIDDKGYDNPWTAVVIPKKPDSPRLSFVQMLGDDLKERQYE